VAAHVTRPLYDPPIAVRRGPVLCEVPRRCVIKLHAVSSFDNGRSTDLNATKLFSRTNCTASHIMGLRVAPYASRVRMHVLPAIVAEENV